MADKVDTEAVEVVVTAKPLGEVVGGSVVTGGDALKAVDYTAFMNLGSYNKFLLRQNDWIAEGATCGMWPNGYIISGVTGAEGADEEPRGLFILKEHSSCLARCCLQPRHSTVTKAYNAVDTGEMIKKGCCGCGPEPRKKYAADGAPAVMSMERPGICNGKCPNCFVCMECCQDEMIVHAGDIQGTAGEIPPDQSIGRGIQPMGGGGCTPTLNVMDRTDRSKGEVSFGVIEGPTFFGGCLDLCSDTFFTISREKGRAGDIGIIRKVKPEGCGETCRQVCSDADTYEITITDTTLTPQQKAVILGEIIHLDYMFFQQDNQFCSVEVTSDAVVIYVHLCNYFCYGCTCPCFACLPIPTSG